MTTFKEYKENIYLKNLEQIVINKKANIRGKEILILSFVKDLDSNKLWTVQKITPNNNEDYNIFEIETNREEYRNRIKSSNEYDNINLSQIKIQENTINFTYSQGISIEYAHGNQINMIKYFIDSGLLTDEWNDVDIENIIFKIYEQSEEEDFPTINFDKNINITLNIEEFNQEVLIEHPLIVKIGQVEKDTKIYYKDSEGVEDFFYLDEVIKYDLHKDTLEKIEKNIEYIEEDQRQNYIDTVMNDIEQICPKDMDATSIYYETENNTQLVFHTREKLQAKPVYSTSCTGLMCISEENYGINGCNKYVDMLCTVEKDFNGELEIELFSKYKNIPAQVISFEI